MSSKPISGLTAGNPALSGDLIPIDRSGVNYKVTASSIAALSTSLPTGVAVGDTIRWNEYGDNTWDVVTGRARALEVVSDGTSNSFSVGYGSAPVSVGTTTRSLFSATATEMNGNNLYNIGGVGSLNQLVSLEQGFGASNGTFTYGTFYRLANRMMLGAGLGITNCRFWWGLTFTSPQFAGTAYSTDTYGASHPCVAFRWSSGTDTNIQAVVGSGSAQTVVDTGVAPNLTASQLFEILSTASGYVFMIDGVVVAGPVNTNKPTTSNLYGVSCCIGDNKNTSTNIGFTHWYSILMLK